MNNSDALRETCLIMYPIASYASSYIVSGWGPVPRLPRVDGTMYCHQKLILLLTRMSRRRQCHCLSEQDLNL